MAHLLHWSLLASSVYFSIWFKLFLGVERFDGYTEKGAKASAATMTVIETAKRNSLDVYGYLLYLLTALPALGKVPSEDSLIPLLPWSDSLPDYCKAVYGEILG